MLQSLLVDGLLAAALLITASGAARGESKPAVDAQAPRMNPLGMSVPPRLHGAVFGC